MRSRPQKSPSRRFTRWVGLGVVTVVAVVGGGLLAIPLVVRALVWTLELMVGFSVWLVTVASRGEDARTIVTTVVRAMGLALATPQALGVVGALVFVAALALYGLKRLLDSEEEESAQ